MKVGTVIQVKSFSEYIVKAPLEECDGYVAASCIPAGTYVSVKSAQGSVIGIVAGVQHDIKEEYLPFISEEKREVFIPYVNDYRSSYLMIKGIGNIKDGKAIQSLAFAPVVNDVAEIMDRDGIRAFHMPDGRPSFSYYRKLSSSLEPAIVSVVIDRLAEAIPESRAMLDALKKYTERQA